MPPRRNKPPRDDVPPSRPQPAGAEPPKNDAPVILYDGRCDFCIAQARRLRTIARGTVRLRSFHDEGVLADYPGLSKEACMKEIKLVEPGGRICGGAEAVVRAIRWGNPILGVFVWVYYVPGVRHAADRVYRWVAENRHRRVARGG
ncbi:MAG: DUF393 domain-containing protein [Candidatus Krumholzibacteria bacterium]